MDVLAVYRNYVERRKAEGKRHFIFEGGRRSGKTIFICQRLLCLCYQIPNTIVNVASMTQEQGRLGAYADMTDILRNEEWLAKAVKSILSSPREIRFYNGSKIFFNSYDNPETAKGIACDYAYYNELNNFSKQQYTDIGANVRKEIYADYNPMKKFWVSDFFEDGDICHTTWQDNPFLTPMQLQYFADLKAQAERPNASAVDKRNYNIYYKGEYSELRGNVFYKDEFNYIQQAPEGIGNYLLFLDPSAICGNDYFACALTGRDEEGKVYLLDSFSINTGSRDLIYGFMDKCLRRCDRLRIYVEVNGWIGSSFKSDAVKDGYGMVKPWCSTANKVERILDNYHNFKNNLYLVDHPLLNQYMEQVYDFSDKCEHDDNVDALSSSYDIQVEKHKMY